LAGGDMSIDNTVPGLRIVPTRHSVADALSRLETLARARGLTIFARIDFSGDAARAGLSMRPSGLLILGSPAAGTPLMVASPTLAIDLPLKVLAWQGADGGVSLAYNDAAYLQARHHFPPELEKNIAALGALVAKAAGEDP
jgi:uncharacterized protein (DUF302 family)